MFKIWSRSILFLAVPLILSIFTHLWYLAEFPPPSYDEGEYMRRALNVLTGVGPQESVLYDHPYFGPFLLAGILQLINYPYLLNPSADLYSIELLWHIPRTLMGLFAVVDTFLVYKLAERIYNRNVALVASILFAVMPITLFTRWILLDSLLLPFLLSSILLTTYKTNGDGSIKDRNNNIINSNKKKNVTKVVLSGISLGLAIFTKIPVFTMIPLTAYLVFTNNNPKGFKALGIWFIPVVLIPLAWPAYAISVGQFNYWFDGIYYQTNRERQQLFISIIDVAVRDPVLLILGTAGLIFAAIKKDLIILLWIMPFVIFLFVIGYVNSWYLIPLLPASCIAAARLILGLSNSISSKSLQRILPFITISGIGIFGLITTIMSITMNVSSGHFEATALVAEYLHNNDNSNNTTVISNPNHFWILRHIFNLDYNEKDYSEYPDETSVKTESVVLIADPAFMYYLSHGYDPIPELRERIQKMYDLYATRTAKVFKIDTQDGQIAIYINE